MEKLPLEWMLEGGLYALGVPFKERVYGDGIRFQAQIDDVIGGESVENYALKESQITNPIEELIKDPRKHLSEYQCNVLSKNVPLFTRTSGLHNRKYLVYTVHSPEKNLNAQTADSILKERKYDCEKIEIFLPNGLPVDISVGHGGGKSEVCFWGPQRDEEGYLGDSLLKRLREINRSELDTDVFYPILIDILDRN